MTITLLNPDGLPKSDVYHQVAVATGATHVFVSGQVARDADGARVGENDLAAQTEQAYLNLSTALGAAGATLNDVAKVTIYVVDWAPEKMPLFLEGVGRAFATLGAAPVPAVTLIGVAALAEPDLLIEIEATAVL
ncbi:RidA family protein [Cryptosporangium japonicum]|uniref:RidA family protein n=1 Tax=Cryptosporangium japonicum TaxID=80872 RepID=A0ABN0TZC6_9ACTN